jgi:hypothetical protein
MQLAPAQPLAAQLGIHVPCVSMPTVCMVVVVL